jgi:hypothetical protein
MDAARRWFLRRLSLAMLAFHRELSVIHVPAATAIGVAIPSSL